MDQQGYVAPQGNVGSRTYLMEAVPPPVQHKYTEYKDKNCYDGHGGTAIDGSGAAGQTVAGCTTSCDADPACGCATYQASNGMCWLRSNCSPSQFEDSNQYTVYVKQNTAGAKAEEEGKDRDEGNSGGGTDDDRASTFFSFFILFLPFPSPLFLILMCAISTTACIEGQCSACGYNCHGSCGDCGHCNEKPGCDNEAACMGACNSGGNAMWCGGSGQLVYRESARGH